MKTNIRLLFEHAQRREFRWKSPLSLPEARRAHPPPPKKRRTSPAFTENTRHRYTIVITSMLVPRYSCGSPPFFCTSRTASTGFFVFLSQKLARSSLASLPTTTGRGREGGIVGRSSFRGRERNTMLNMDRGGPLPLLLFCEGFDDVCASHSSNIFGFLTLSRLGFDFYMKFSID